MFCGRMTTLLSTKKKKADSRQPTNGTSRPHEIKLPLKLRIDLIHIHRPILHPLLKLAIARTQFLLEQLILPSRPLPRACPPRSSRSTRIEIGGEYAAAAMAGKEGGEGFLACCKDHSAFAGAAEAELVDYVGDVGHFPLLASHEVALIW